MRRPLTRRPRNKAKPSFRPWLEPFEDRLAPATLTWTGTVDANWSTASNQALPDSSHRAPVNGDDGLDWFVLGASDKLSGVQPGEVVTLL